MPLRLSGFFTSFSFYQYSAHCLFALCLLTPCHLQAATLDSDRYVLMVMDDGTVGSYGRNNDGGLGIGRVSRDFEDPLKVVRVGDGAGGASHELTGIVQVVAGGGAFALASDGRVYSWGSAGNLARPYDYYEHRDDYPAKYYAGLVLTETEQPLADIIEIAASDYHAMALTQDGRVYRWGYSRDPENPGHSNRATLLKTSGEPVEGVKSIAAGDDNSFSLLMRDGTVRTAGHYTGGYGDFQERWISDEPVLIEGEHWDEPLTDVVAISMDDRLTVAVREDGSVYAWGETCSYFCFHGAYAQQIFAPTDTSERVVAVSVGQNHVLLEDASGHLWGWGTNSWGQLNIDGNDLVRGDIEAPTRLTSSGRFAAFSAGNGSTRLVRDSGRHETLGLNTGHKDIPDPTVHLPVVDSDGEIVNRHNVYFSDSDQDGMPNWWERHVGLDPLLDDGGDDIDGDGLSNYQEFVLGTNLSLVDTDADGMDDLFESQNGTRVAMADGSYDLDGDGLTNLEEFILGTRVDDSDSDSDGISDYDEVSVHSTDPLNSDSDSDGLIDGYELAHGLNLLVDDAGLDLDRDGLSNLEERVLGTDPANPDSDGDRMNDYYESQNDLNPLRRDDYLDPDGDGRNNLEDYIAQEYPHDYGWRHQLVTSAADVAFPFEHSFGNINGQIALLLAPGRCPGWCDGDFSQSLDTHLLLSSDGETWSSTKTNLRALEQGQAARFKQYASDGTTVVAVGSEGENTGVIYSFTDGTTWHNRYQVQNNVIESVVWSGAQFIAVAGKAILRSSDGVTWSEDTEYTLDWSEFPYEFLGPEGATFDIKLKHYVQGDSADLITAVGVCRDSAGNEYVCPGDVPDIVLRRDDPIDWKVLGNNPVVDQQCAESLCSVQGVSSYGRPVIYDNGFFYWNNLRSQYGIFWEEHSLSRYPMFVSSSGQRLSVNNVAAEPLDFPGWRGDEFYMGADNGRLELTGTLGWGASSDRTSKFNGFAETNGKVFALVGDLLHAFQLVDEDGDGIPTRFELMNRLNPFDAADGDLDADGDGLKNRYEYVIGTDIWSRDSDGDGLSDSREDELAPPKSDPLNADTDGDGLPDGYEWDLGLNPVDFYNSDAQSDLDGDGVNNLLEYLKRTDPADENSFPYVKNDFDRDGNSDLLQRDKNGNTSIGLLGNSSQYSPTSQHSGTRWKVAARGDFDGDGHADLFWRHANGQAKVWLMSGQLVSASLPIEKIYNSNWQLLGSGDYNGDGKSDILWRHKDGRTRMWMMDGHTISASPFTTLKAHSSWRYLASADATGNGYTDILWLDKNGRTVCWSMSGERVNWSQHINENMSGIGDYHANGDFNGDGKSDILWRRKDGVTSIWMMDAYRKLEGHLTSLQNSRGWRVQEVGDFNGDSFDDILWRSKSGQRHIWYMNGAEVIDRDRDLDGVSDSVELQWNLNPLSSDSDGDGFSDALEISTPGLNPNFDDTQIDADGDGLMNSEEVQLGTDLLNADSDGDLIGDALEVDKGLDPLVDDSLLDPDGDTLSSFDEITSVFTDPLRADTDGDGAEDGAEVTATTDPLKADTDDDGMDDGYELATVGLDPKVDDATSDLDSDGFINLVEYRLASDANNINDTPHVASDFNGTGFSDIMLTLAANDDIAYLNYAAGFGAGVPLYGLADNRVQRSIGDYSGDGKSSLLTQNSVDATLEIRTVGGEGSQYTASVQHGFDWKVRGSADFNNDGKAEILWQHKSTKVLKLWSLDGAAVTETDLSYQTASKNWLVKKLGDFDGDGNADILWQNKASSKTQVWFMDGATVRERVLTNKLWPLSTWKIQQVGDFDGDRKADILWRHKDGRTRLWLMNGAHVASAPYTSAKLGNGWKVDMLGDYNADGKADVLWRHSKTNNLRYWLMDGKLLQQQVDIDKASIVIVH